MTRRTVLASLAVAAVGLVTACRPVPPAPELATQACDAVFTSAAGYQAAFDALTHARTGWITADGFVPTALPDGSTVWWMADTYTGVVNPDGSAPGAAVVHNSRVTQRGDCLAPTMGGSAWHWTDLVPQSADGWYWPASSIVEGDTVLVFAWRVAPASGPDGFDWNILGTSVARFSVPELKLLDVTTLTTQPDEVVPFGVRSVAVDGTVYLYGERDGDVYAARAPFASVRDPSAWEYWAGALWTPVRELAVPMTFAGVDPSESQAPIAQLSVVRYGSRYLATAFGWDVVDPRVKVWLGDTPQGPWEYLGVAATAERRDGQFAYDARLVELPGAGWTVVYGVNDPEHNREDVTLYGGRLAAPNAGVLPAP